MAFDYAKLNGRIVEKYKTQRRFADAMGCSELTISRKLNNKAPWKQNEILRACDLLGISSVEVPEYFFRPEVQVLN